MLSKYFFVGKPDSISNWTMAKFWR